MNSRLIEFFRSPIGNAITHIAFATIIVAIVLPVEIAIYILLGPIVLIIFNVWLAPTLYYLGRERRDVEIHEAFDPLENWYRKWNPFEWYEDSRRDFFAPVIFYAIMCIIALAFIYTR